MNATERQVLEKFGENLRRYRMFHRITQESLGLSCGVHRTQFTLMENGLRTPGLLTYLKICGALQVSTEDLVRGISWQTGFGGSFSVDHTEGWKP